MSWFGTDAVALACILGGAAVSGGATLAMMDGGEWVEAPCVVDTGARTNMVVVGGTGHARAVVVAPNFRVHSRGGCGVERVHAVEVHIDRHLEAQEHHMEAMEVYLESMEGQLEIQMEGLAHQLEGLEMELGPEFEQEIEARVEAELRKVEEKLEKLGGAGIR